MPAQVVVVLREAELGEQAVAALRAAGYDAAVFPDSMQALRELEASRHAELLITSVNFERGKPNGLALARMTRMRRPDLKVIFTDGPDAEEHVNRDGMFLPSPLHPGRLADMVARLMQRPG
jgi:DNA-binding NtrC family response regulator